MSVADIQNSILNRVCSLKIWKRGDETAPHKPILLLYVIANLSKQQRLHSFVAVENALSPLLRAVLENKNVVEPRYPFWRLQNDGIWEVQSDAPMTQRRGNTDPLRSELISKNARGGLTQEIFDVLLQDGDFRHRIIRLILERYFTDKDQAKLRKLLKV